MKIIILTILLLLSCTHQPAQAINEIIKAISQNEKFMGKETVGGKYVGDGAEETLFYIKAMSALEVGTIKDYKNMLIHKSNAVKLLGAWCLAKKDKVKYRTEIMKLYNNKTKIMVFPGGCVGYPMAVGKVAKKFSENPEWIE